MLLRTTERIGWHWPASAAICLSLGLAGCATHPTASTRGSSTTPVANNLTAGPVMGYVWDQVASGLRPIVGLPGAAYLGPAIFNSGAYTAGVACGQKQYALLTGTKGEVSLTTLPSGNPVELAGQLSAKQKIVLSPACSTALVYAPDASEVLLLEGLPAAPAVKTLHISGSGPIVGGAVSDSGAILIASGQSGGTIAIDGIGSDGSSDRSIASLSSFGGLAFVSNTDSALIADAGRNVVWRQSSLNSGGSLTQVAAAADGVARPTALASSADGRWAVILNGQASILRIDLSKNLSSTTVACNCFATELVPLSGNLVFRLNDVGVDPLWAFDGDISTSRVVFIPGARHVNPTGAAQ